MNGARVLLEMLKAHNVEHVFGLPGETTLPLYLEWHDFPAIKHILVRDERSAAYMADAYARVAFKPGVCEGPSVGATHFVPGVTEAYKASLPMILLTSDIPLHCERWNMLTGFDQTSLYKGITKATFVVLTADEIPGIIRRAFRCATTNVPGPVHIRIPIDVFEQEVEDPDLYADPDFGRFPGHRSIAETNKIEKALTVLAGAANPLIVCGQGALYSQAWEEVTELAEHLVIPVATTMTGKGSIDEHHPLSIGVIGARGGTSFSNGVLHKADVVFFIGSNTDSASTAGWTLPSLRTKKKLIHLDFSEAEVGNMYPTDVVLLGDAKATLQAIIARIKGNTRERDLEKDPRVRKLRKDASVLEERKQALMRSAETPVHPLRFLKELEANLPDRHTIVADPGVSAIYLSAFHKVVKAGRSTIFNYGMGALGYALPASIGAYVAKPNQTVVCLTGDGSFGFCAGELETLSRIGANVKIFLFNNSCYGWIRAAFRFGYKPKYFATDFKDVDYVSIAEGYGVRALRVDGPDHLASVLHDTFSDDLPVLVDIKARSEEELVPPVPSWARQAEELGLPFLY